MSQKPSNEQLALFARRLKRAMSNQESRRFFGVANGEDDFVSYPDVLRTVEWIEDLVNGKEDQPAPPAGPKKITLRKVAS
jgi:hypothetical protein